MANWRIDETGLNYRTYLDLEEGEHPELEGYVWKSGKWAINSEGKEISSGEEANEAAAKKVVDREAKELLKDLDFGGKAEAAAPKMALIHLSDWNMQDKAYEFPEKLIEELHDRMVKDGGTAWQKQDKAAEKKMKEHWDWFFKHAKLTKGIEDADYFLDYSAPKESAAEWFE